jgi:Protein of unknown function (DUF1045)
MSEAPRYALYLAPMPGTPLWQAGSALLGYDAATGRDMPFPAPFAQDGGWPVLTEDPRRYGFHMTLKAPFRLAPEVDIEDLEKALAGFARGIPAFTLAPLALECRMRNAAEGFVCLAPRDPSEDLSALEAAVVPAFERFRAPLTEAERARRKPESLPARERAYLEDFGYPYVLEAFRPHFSLTGLHANPHTTKNRLDTCLADLALDLSCACRAIFLFEQPSAGERFRLRSAFALAE